MGVGIPLWFLDKALTKTGLDRVFDSLKENKSFQEYLKQQAAAKNIRDFGLGQIADWGLDELRSWISTNGYLDPLFDVISPTLGTTPDPLVKTIVYVDPLVLDLDGDGLEITPLSKGILFDANGDALNRLLKYLPPCTRRQPLKRSSLVPYHYH